MDDLTKEAMSDWRCLIKAAGDGDKRCLAFLPLLERVVADPLARRVFPHFSVWTLRFSRCPNYPFDLVGPDVDLAEDRPGFYQFDSAPPIGLEEAVSALLPILQIAQVYAGNQEEPR